MPKAATTTRPTLVPAVDGHYRVIRPTESFEDIDGCLVTFTWVEFMAEELDKPEKVLAFVASRKSSNLYRST